MKRVIAVILIAALTTLMVGVDRTSWASQEQDQKKREAQREAVTRDLRGMSRGSTVRIERTDGTTVDAVIQDIMPDAVTVVVADRDQTMTQVIAIADIARIEKISLKKMSKTSKVLIGVAVGLGVLVIATVAACASTTYGAGPRHEIPAAN
jgi:hypothetical protein